MCVVPLWGGIKTGLITIAVTWSPRGKEGNGVHQPCRVGVPKWGGYISPSVSGSLEREDSNKLHKPSMPLWGPKW